MATTPKRIWQLGAAKIEDKFSALPFNQSYEMLVKERPQARHTIVYESDAQVQDDGSLLYVIPLIPAKTNG